MHNATTINYQSKYHPSALHNFTSHLPQLLQSIQVRLLILVLVATLDTLTQSTALPACTVTLAVLLQAFALLTCALLHLLFLDLNQSLVLTMDFPLFGVVAILATTQALRTGKAHLQALAVVLLTLGAATVAALPV